MVSSHQLTLDMRITDLKFWKVIRSDDRNLDYSGEMKENEYLFRSDLASELLQFKGGVYFICLIYSVEKIIKLHYVPNNSLKNKLKPVRPEKPDNPVIEMVVGSLSGIASINRETQSIFCEGSDEQNNGEMDSR